MSIKRRGPGPSPRVEHLESRTLLTAPVLDPISAKTLPAGKSLIVPLTATDTDGNPLTYSVTSSSPAIAAEDPQRRPRHQAFGRGVRRHHPSAPARGRAHRRLADRGAGQFGFL